MTRKEKIQKAAEHYEQVDATNLACDYGWGDCDIQQQCFKAGVEWADQHPREGLWDKEKVIKWLRANVDNYANYNVKTDECFVNDFEEDLIKAMED